jgi:hypothetical protein
MIIPRFAFIDTCESGSDPGSYRDALRRFAVSEFNPIDDDGRERTDALAPAEPVSFHYHRTSAGGAHNHAR